MGCGASAQKTRVQTYDRIMEERAQPQFVPEAPRAPPKEPPLSLEQLLATLHASGNACRRLGAELQRPPNPDTHLGVGLMPPTERGADLLSWRGVIEGPEKTPYYGYQFKVALEFSDEYPFKPPRVHFLTPIFHINVSEKGKICLSVLHDADWSALLTARDALACIRTLMECPNADDPLNMRAADLWERSRALYDAEARRVTSQYATRLAAGERLPRGASMLMERTGTNTAEAEARVQPAESAGKQESAAERRKRNASRAQISNFEKDNIAEDPLAVYQTTRTGAVVNEEMALRKALAASARER